MKKVLIYIAVTVAVLIGAFFAYVFFKPKSAAQVVQTEVAELNIPKGWRPPASEVLTTNYGGKYYQFDKDGVGEDAGVMFRFHINDNDDNMDCDGIFTNVMIRDLQEIRMSEVEYISEKTEEPDSIIFNGMPALRYYYVLKNEPYDEAEKAKNPRSAYKKGEAIAVSCGNKCVIMYYETFEEHWDMHKTEWDAIKAGVKLHCK